jgi:hypothetical protein
LFCHPPNQKAEQWSLGARDAFPPTHLKIKQKGVILKQGPNADNNLVLLKEALG